MDMWFVTAGVPGGEYAMRADTKRRAVNTFALYFERDMMHVREAPPELAEWLDVPEGAKREIDSCGRYKTEGGWVELQYGQAYVDGIGWSESVVGAVFIPVALASGITVIGSPASEEQGDV